MRDDSGCGLFFCTDGIDPFADGSTIDIGEFINLSLPPQERYKTENMLLYMFVPSKFTAATQKKFFDFVVAKELAPLHHSGIGDMAVRVVGFSLDLKGRDKFLDQKACNGYFGCSVCHTQFCPGISKKVTFTGARLWLPMGHPLRAAQHDTYEFISHERRAPPPLRTTATVREAVALVQEANLDHFMGTCIYII